MIKLHQFRNLPSGLILVSVTGQQRRNSRMIMAPTNRTAMWHPKCPIPEDLPKLPLPPLKQTLERYLHGIQAVVPEDAYKRTQQLVAEFTQNQGKELQDELERYAAQRDNWAYDWWLDDMYLKNRLALPINSNPGMVFPVMKFGSSTDQARFAAEAIYGLLDFKEKLDSESLAIDRMPSGAEKGRPLCMAQHYRLLTVYRRPGIEKDQQVPTESGEPNPNQDVLVAKGQQFHLVRVIEESTRVPRAILEEQLVAILNSEDSNEAPVGVLSSDDRRVWGRNYQTLCRDSENKVNLDAIERSLCVICFDEPLPTNLNRSGSSGVSGRDDTNRARQMIYGGGIKHNTANRWFDKTIQIVVTSDGACGLCYEHSAAEGIVVIQLMEELVQSFERGGSALPDNTVKWRPSRKLKWNLNEELKMAIAKSAAEVDKMGEDLDFFVYRYSGYGREFPKKIGASPDAYIQLALQLAYYKDQGKLTCTYESAATRRFRFGRVDNIRASHPEALAWTRAMESNATREKKVELFRAAVKTQTEIMTYNIQGHGIDCHLLALRELAAGRGQRPALFQDSSYAVSNHFSLSTSQVPTTTDSFMGYGAVVPDGYGCSYNPHADSIVFCVSSFKSDPSTSTEKYTKCLLSALDEMMTLLST